MVAETKQSTLENQSAVVTELAVEGMTCSNCARHVTEAIQSVSGVRSAMVSLDARKASVRWSPEARPDVPDVIRAIKAAGYSAEAVDVQIPNHVEHKLAGWQLNLWIGALGTVPLML